MISIILPAYNEEKAIKQSIDKINEVMNKIKKYPYEIIVIDDGSNDKTYEHAKKNMCLYHLRMNKQKSIVLFFLNHLHMNIKTCFYNICI